MTAPVTISAAGRLVRDPTSHMTAGGKRKNLSNKERKARRDAGVGRGSAGKAIVAGVKNRESERVSVAVVERTDAATLHKLVTDPHRTHRDGVYKRRRPTVACLASTNR